MNPLNILCAGAAQGLVKAVQAPFLSDTGAAVQGRFGAVGAMKEALAAGEACDVMVVTAAMVASLTASGELRAGSAVAIGSVRTGIATRHGQPRPDVSTPAALKQALLASTAIFFPDPERATAGIHFAKVMRELGIYDAVQARFRNYPNGATSMRELAGTTGPGTIGCTQVSEILYTDGIELVGALPAQFELATVYTAAVAARAAQPALAARFIACMAGASSRELRAAGGFE